MPLSYSQIRTYRRCPKQYDYAFLKKVPRPISAGESFGTSIHSALKKWGELEKKLQTPKKSSEKIALPLFDEHDEAGDKPLTLTTLKEILRNCFVGQGYGSHAEMDAALLRANEALTNFFEWWKTKQRTVLAVEKAFTLAIEDETAKEPIAIAGRFDRVELTDDGLHIIDFKTGTPVTDAQANIDLQLSIYALAARKLWDKPVAALSLLYLGEEGCTDIVTHRNASELKDSEAIIHTIAHRMGSGDRTATPSIQVCRFCPYREICPVRAV